MKIREIQIDGFGALRNASVKGLREGLNVLYGSNEFGKTTLLEFIRRILFGFPKRAPAGANSYLPQDGGPCGGALACDLAGGESIRIRRLNGPGGGKLVLTDGDGTVLPQERLADFLNHASPELFHNIFAFTLDELQVLGSLQGDDIKNRIYGAGLGLGPTVLTDTETELRRRCEALFLPRGKNQKLAVLLDEMNRLRQSIADLQNELEQFDLLQAENRDLERRRETLGATLSDQENRLRHLEILDDLYPSYLEWSRANRELESPDPATRLTEQTGETLERIHGEISALDRRIEEEAEAQSLLQAEMAQIRIDDRLLDRREEILALVNMTEQVRSILRDRLSVGDQRDRLDYEIQSDLQRLGRGWNEKSVAAFHVSDLEMGRISSQRERLDENRQRLALAQERLEEHRQERARETAKAFRPPEWLRVVAMP